VLQRIDDDNLHEGFESAGTVILPFFYDDEAGGAEFES
jgi:hypothetical protein